MAAGSTYTPIATTTLGSAQATVTFSSISASYTDLVLIAAQGNNQNTDYDIYIRFNGDSGSNYSRTQLVGNGSTASSSRSSNNTEIRLGPSIDNTPTSLFTLNVMNYSNTTTNKTALIRSGQASGYTVAEVGLWRNTAAITSISFTLQGGYSYVAGSTFTLYGIAAA
jgi:hypothetical protein